MKVKIIFLAGLLIVTFQNCGGMKSELLDAATIECQDCVQSCRASELPEIQSQLSGSNLILELTSPQDPLVNLPSQWLVQDQSGRSVAQTQVESTESFFVDLRNVQGCAVYVSATSSENDCSQILRKTIQISTCNGPVTTTTFPHMTTTTQPRPVTTTTLAQPVTTTSLPRPQTGIGPEPVPGCVAQYSTQTVGWDAVFHRWPGYGMRPRLIIPSGTTLTFEFKTHAHAGLLNPQIDPGYGTISGLEFPGDGDGAMLMTISTTPGCVDVSKLHPRCFSSSQTVSLGYHEGGSASGYSCPLEFGKTYYFNLTFGTASAPAGPFVPYCPGGVCGKDVINQIQ